MENMFNIIMLTMGGTLAGIVVGAIPGLSATMAVAILVSLTFSWDIVPALAVMMGVVQGVNFGGAITACLINIPGAPSCVATTFDGYKLAQRGEGGIAIGHSCIQSFFGAIIGGFALMFLTPLISEIALGFAPQDYFLLAVFGILLVGSLAEGSFTKALFTAALGITIGLIGMDLVTGQPRLTFGSIMLLKGVDLVTAILGLFGLSEVFYQLYQKPTGLTIQKINKIIPPLKENFKYMGLTIRASIIGVFIGALPGVGGPVASLLAYDHAKRTVKNPSYPFGEGAYEGVIAPEAANNAVIGGAMIPMLALGIPGDAVAAIMIGAFRIHGLKPGPLLMTESPDSFNVLVVSLFWSSIFFLIFGLLSVRPFAKLISIPQNKLLPPVFFITVVGAYAINSSMIEVAWMFFFGILGFIFKLYNYPVAPMILGLVLGPLMDETFRQTMILHRGNFLSLFNTMITSPISIAVVVIVVFTVFVMPKSVSKADSTKV